MSTEKKLGRPFSGSEPLSRDVKFRVSETTYKKLEKYSNDNSITVAETVRKSVNEFLKNEEK